LITKYVMRILYIQILVLKDTEILLKVKDLILIFREAAQSAASLNIRNLKVFLERKFNKTQN
jgi:hypothetical protein